MNFETKRQQAYRFHIKEKGGEKTKLWKWVALSMIF